MNDTKNDPLKQLLVSESQAINRQELVELLLPYTAIQKETKEVAFTSQFLELKNNQKVLILLATIKARALILPDVDDKISPLEIIKMEIIPEGSVKTSLKSLLNSHEIKSEKGRYYLPNYKVPQVVSDFKKVK